jgi:hypothetical protein
MAESNPTPETAAAGEEKPIFEMSKEEKRME